MFVPACAAQDAAALPPLPTLLLEGPLGDYDADKESPWEPQVEGYVVLPLGATLSISLA